MDTRFSTTEIAKFISECDIFSELFYESTEIFESSEYINFQKKFSSGSVVTASDCKLNFLYENYRHGYRLKSQAEFFFNILTFSISQKNILLKSTDFPESHFHNPENQYWVSEDFGYYIDELMDYIITIKAEIDLLEDKEGVKYWKNNLFLSGSNRRRKLEKNPVKEDSTKKQSLQLVIKRMENEFHNADNTKMADVINLLLSTGFNTKKMAEDIGGRVKKKYSKDVYLDAITKLNKIVTQLNLDMPE